MNDAKVYTDPGFKLSSLAKELAIPAHQVSKLLNENQTSRSTTW